MRVLDFGQWRPAPYATQLLADLGAEVLKVEPPGEDPMRVFPEIFATVAGHKRSVVLDLKDPAGLSRALELAAQADVVVEGWRPGVAARLGVGPDDVARGEPHGRVLLVVRVRCGGAAVARHRPRRELPGTGRLVVAGGWRAVTRALAPRPVGRPRRWSRRSVRDLRRVDRSPRAPVKARRSTCR